MSWRIVTITGRAKLELRAGYMVVRKEDTYKIFLSEISTLIIESTQVSITSSLLCELSKRKIKVIFCDEKRNPCSELVGYYGSHDTSIRIKQQIDWDSTIKGLVWTEIVTEKIRKQSELLEALNLPEAEKLKEYIKEVQFADASNREGHAAKVYFNALFGMEFTRTADNYINAALNYGYGILLSAFNREIVASGYLTQLGLFHENQFNHFNLSSDLMEPFRPVIDRHVRNNIPQKFEHEEKIAIVDLLNEEVVIDGKVQYVNNAIKIYCRSIFDALNEKDVSLIKFYKNEL